MTLAPEQNLSTSEAPLVTFGIVSKNIDLIYSEMVGSYGDKRTFGIDTNWCKIHDYRYDIYRWLSLSVRLDYKKLDGPGRPQYANTYYILGELHPPDWAEAFGYKGMQKELENLDVHADLTKVWGHEALLVGNYWVSIKSVKESTSTYDEIYVIQHDFDPVKGCFVTEAFPLTTAEDFADKFHIFENTVEKLMMARYKIEGKHLPEAKLILTPHVEEKAKSSSPAKVPCNYCGSHFENSLGRCPHCGGPRGSN